MLSVPALQFWTGTDDGLREDHVITRRSIGLTLLFCSTLCSTVSAADFRPLDVKTGEWESTVSGRTTGMPPIPDEVLNKMTPEQRAKIQAAMGAANGGKPMVSKSCITKDSLDKAFNLGDNNTKACARTLVTSSGTKQEIRVDCSRDGGKTVGTIKVEALDSENIKGSMQITSSNGAHNMNMDYTFNVKWIGSACSEK
jgi:hypothetical protein